MKQMDLRILSVNEVGSCCVDSFNNYKNQPNLTQPVFSVIEVQPGLCPSIVYGNFVILV